jgi:hypothetical protein
LTLGDRYLNKDFFNKFGYKEVTVADESWRVLGAAFLAESCWYAASSVVLVFVVLSGPPKKAERWDSSQSDFSASGFGKAASRWR